MFAMKIITYSSLIFSGLNINRFKYYKKRFKLTNLVEIHHIIPRQHTNHPIIIKTKYNIDDGYNLMFLPTYKGKNKLNLHLDRPIHQYGHYKYNMFIKSYLDNLLESNNYSKLDIINLNIFLRKNLRHLTIPWN